MDTDGTFQTFQNPIRASTVATGLTTVKQLLSLKTLVEGKLVGGEEGIGAYIEDIEIISAQSPKSAIFQAQNKVIILDASSFLSDNYQIDITLREASDAKCSALIITNQKGQINISAIRLANKLALPLVVILSKDPLELADELRRVIRLPFIQRSDAVLRVAERFKNLPKLNSIASALGILSFELNAHVALVGANRSIVVQSEGSHFTMPDEIELLDVAISTSDHEDMYISQPLSLAPRERPSFWVIAKMTSPSESWVKTGIEVLGFTAWFFSAALIGERLVQERDARFRLGVLNAISAASDHPDPALINQLGVLGWRVDGWCTAIHGQAIGEIDPLRILNGTPELQQKLQSIGFVGPLIERPDGWSGWIVEKSEPQSRTFTSLINNLRQAIEGLASTSPGLKLYFGLGRSHEGILGLQASLTEAKEACTIAKLGGKNWDVQHIDEMGVKRILLGWYESETFADFATNLLQPVRSVDTDGTLFHTLETYLDCNCSPSDVADALNIHRNTVINRVEKLKSLLKLNFDEADERLALQLACRVIKRQWES